MNWRRDDHMFVHLQQAARAALRRLTSDPFYADGMVAIVFTAFMLEAYCNHMGRRLRGAAWDTKADSTRTVDEKLKAIAHHYGINLSQWSGDLDRLLDLRDLFAHGVTSSVAITQADSRPGMNPEWMADCGLAHVQRMHDAALGFMRAVHEAAGLALIELEVSGSWGNVHVDPPHGPPKPHRRGAQRK